MQLKGVVACALGIECEAIVQDGRVFFGVPAFSSAGARGNRSIENDKTNPVSFIIWRIWSMFQHCLVCNGSCLAGAIAARVFTGRLRLRSYRLTASTISSTACGASIMATT